MRDLLSNALRMRPDRIILGEIRGAEALDVLQAMNTGHDGSMSTIHANAPREALTRLENMVGMTGINLPSTAVRTQIAAAVHLIAQVNRMRDGIRRVTHIIEVVGMEGDVITTQELFTFQFQGETDRRQVARHLPIERHSPRISCRAPSITGSIGPCSKSFDLMPRYAALPRRIDASPAETSVRHSRSLCARSDACDRSSARDDAWLCLVAYALSEGAGGRRFKRRLAAVRDRAQGSSRPTTAATRSLARQQSATPKIDRIARQWLPRRDMLAARLARTGRAISVGQYAIASVRPGCVLRHRPRLHRADRHCPEPVLGLLIGTALPHKIVGRMGKRRVAAFVALFPEAIDLMVRALRSGLPISEAIIGAGHEIADPVGNELGRVEAGMRMGRDLDSLLWDIAARIDVPEFRFFIIALSVQRETGGNLAETLANLADVLRRRRQMRAKVRAMSSETRATTMILGGMPILVIVMLALSSPALPACRSTAMFAVSFSTASRWPCSAPGSSS